MLFNDLLVEERIERRVGNSPHALGAAVKKSCFLGSRSGIPIFSMPISRRKILKQVPLQHAATISATIGSALEEPVLPGLITVGLSNDPAEMQVHTYDPSGEPAARSFHIACFRD